MAEEQINPYPRQVCRVEKLRQWTFEADAAGWRALHDCRLNVREGRLRITSTGSDPYLYIPAKAPAGMLRVRLRAKCRTEGRGQLFWITRQDPGWGERKSTRFNLTHDGRWHTYEVPLPVRGDLSGLRLDPGSAPGLVEVERLELLGGELHPLQIVRLDADAKQVRVAVRNHADRAMSLTVCGTEAKAAAGKTAAVPIDAAGKSPFEAFVVEVRSEHLAPLRRTTFLCRPRARADWIVRQAGRLTLRAAPDGAGAWLLRDGRILAALAPLVHRDGTVPKLRPASSPDAVGFEGDGLRVRLSLAGDELAVSIRAERPCQGPCLRAIGALEQGLFAGLEYLGKGERSSSKLDIETPEHLRFAPDPVKVTMPLMACVTDRGTVAMTWKDMSLRPVFASPNFFDGSADHLMALRGKEISATILAGAAAPVEEAVLWAVKKRGLPPLPKAPRSVEQQWALSLRSIHGPISGKGGWGHCAEPRWGRQPYGDVVSTIWRLTGTAPDVARLVPGGAHVANDAAWFVTGRAAEWLKVRSGQARGLIASQKPDGSFRYRGKYRRGHFEDTASGCCARPACTLLEFARVTGDADARAAGLKALDYMKRFRTPRGAQTWELSLHTPDVLASAYLVGAYVRGYELTGRKAYLREARRWALSGVPFVYQWGRHPVMTYATAPVYGATNWRAPNWIGLPVQWCGGVYAYWLTKLAPHDRTLDWNRLARGILIAGEQMQYPDGPKVGCLPDVFYLGAQRRAGPSINPCALVSLRLAVAGEVESLAVASDGKHRVAAPFAVEIRGGKAHVRAKAGATYQVLIDGRRIVEVRSKGRDTIEL